MDSENTNLKKYIGVPIGLILSVVMGAILERSAEAAVRVRPNLAEVGFIDATLSQHPTDWIYYHMPTVGYAITTVFVTTVVSLMVYSHYNSRY